MAHVVPLSYGTERVGLRLPDTADVLQAGGGTPLADPEAAITDALEHPIGTQPLRELVTAGKPRTVAITISDVTRAVPNQSFLPSVLRCLNEAGIDDGQVTIVIGNGMHRACTPQEIDRLVGPEIAQRVDVVNHHATATEDLVQVTDDPPIRLNRVFAEADFRIVTGFIEPHFMAGYSGGRKGVCPALVDLETVQAFHGFQTLSQPTATAGVLNGNPCHEIALRVAKAVGVDFLVNVTTTRDHQPSAFFCGDLEAAHARGCTEVARLTAVTLSGRYDLVVTTGGGAPLDLNFYQTVKGMTMALPAVEPSGGILAILSACSEGLGGPAYRDLLFRYGKDWHRFLNDIQTNKHRTELDQWEFQMQCRVLEHVGLERLRLYTDGVPTAEQERLALDARTGPRSAPERLQADVDAFVQSSPDARIAVIPDGAYTMLG